MVNSETQGKVIFNELEPQDDFTGDIYPLHPKSKYLFVYQTLCDQ